MPNGILKSLAFSILFCFLALPMAALGQTDPNLPYALSNELNVEVNPSYPRPNESVSISLSMYTESLETATITWYKNGKSVLSGKGAMSYSFTAGAMGERTEIEISISLFSGASFSKNIVIIPAGVDLVWEALSTVPAFYQGKAPHTPQGLLKVVAMPEFVRNGRRLPAGELTYKWTSGTQALQSQSGYGKNSITIGGSLLGRTESIRVTVTDPVSNMTAYGSLNLSPALPEILFYRVDPYYGHMFNQAMVGNWSLNTEEVQLLAVPFGFSKDNWSNLTYAWSLNYKSAPSLYGSRTAIFKKPEDSKGQSIISLRVENTDKILQQADSRITINFGK